MSLPGTSIKNSMLPKSEEIAHVIATARISMVDVPISLGCARNRADHKIDCLAVDCGVNRIAIPSDEAIKKAEEYNLNVKWKKTCCSISINEVGV